MMKPFNIPGHMLFDIIVLFLLTDNVAGLQRFTRVPTYREVDPGHSVVLPCHVADRVGECRWEKDGEPKGIYTDKYEWAAADPSGQPVGTDCSLRILAASIEYDSGVWQCQVTASDFTQKDTLISEGAELVVRVAPKTVVLEKAGGSSGNGNNSPSWPPSGSTTTSTTVSARAGEQLHLECSSEGGSPAPQLSWHVAGIKVEGKTEQENTRLSDGTWRSVARLLLPVSREDNGASVECRAEHPSLAALGQALTAQVKLNIFYPPRVVSAVRSGGESSPAAPLKEGRSVELTCQVDSNPPATVSWRKLEEGPGGSRLVSNAANYSLAGGVKRTDAGTYQCLAENELGLSQPATVVLEVQYAPVITKLMPDRLVEVRAGSKQVLTCQVAGHPQPAVQWLQQQPSGQVLVRGYDPKLVIESVAYEHQGEFVCSARNPVGQVQSEPVRIDVKGAPRIDRFGGAGRTTEYVVGRGESVDMEVRFCGKPRPQVAWIPRVDVGGVTPGGRSVTLGPNDSMGRYQISGMVDVSDNLASVQEEKTNPLPGGQKTLHKDCYSTMFKVTSAEVEDSGNYLFTATNEFGSDNISIRLVVIDTSLLSQEILTAIIVGGILTILILSLIIIYLVKADRCCSLTGSANGAGSNVQGSDGGTRSGPAGKKGQQHNTTDHGSDRTDVESCHSSSPSSQEADDPHTVTVLPPDALYGTVQKHVVTSPHGSAGGKNNNVGVARSAAYFEQHLFNDSKEALRPDLLGGSGGSSFSGSGSSRGTSPNNMPGYSDLCYPHTANRGSMKQKKNKNQLAAEMERVVRSQGVDCQLDSSMSSGGGINSGTYTPGYQMELENEVLYATARKVNNAGHLHQPTGHHYHPHQNEQQQHQAAAIHTSQIGGPANQMYSGYSRSDAHGNAAPRTLNGPYTYGAGFS